MNSVYKEYKTRRKEIEKGLWIKIFIQEFIVNLNFLILN
jgi:hypothetical protein